MGQRKSAPYQMNRLRPVVREMGWYGMDRHYTMGSHFEGLISS